MEKRLGIAQLLLLLTIIVVMTLTRGSRGESFWDLVTSPIIGSEALTENRPGGRKNSLKEWSRRRLKSLSLLSFRSRSPPPMEAAECSGEYIYSMATSRMGADII